MSSSAVHVSCIYTKYRIAEINITTVYHLVIELYTFIFAFIPDFVCFFIIFSVVKIVCTYFIDGLAKFSSYVI
jgi:hypothetical protein